MDLNWCAFQQAETPSGHSSSVLTTTANLAKSNVPILCLGTEKGLFLLPASKLLEDHSGVLSVSSPVFVELSSMYPSKVNYTLLALDGSPNGTLIIATVDSDSKAYALDVFKLQYSILLDIWLTITTRDGTLAPRWISQFKLDFLPYRVKMFTDGEWWVGSVDGRIYRLDLNTVGVILNLSHVISASSGAVSITVGEWDGQWMCALGCQDGSTELYSWKEEGLGKWYLESSYAEDGPISCVEFFVEGSTINLLAVRSIGGYAIVFSDITNSILRNISFCDVGDSDSLSCCKILPDLNGTLSLMFGSFSGRVFVGKRSNCSREFSLLRTERFAHPITALSTIDFTNDGQQELVVFSSRGINVLQYI